MYRVVDEAEPKRAIEEHSNPLSAYRAMLICNAQEVQNGRPAKYRCVPAIDPPPHPRDLNLPNWVRSVLGI